jgi:ribonuclease HI
LTLLLQVDGTPGGGQSGIAGLGVIVRAVDGQVLVSRAVRAYAATSGEAEYLAIIAGLELMIARFPNTTVRVLSDHAPAVEQLSGRAAVRAERLKQLHTRASALVLLLPRVEFVAITREVNRLADALAWEALGGRSALLRAARRRGS